MNSVKPRRRAQIDTSDRNIEVSTIECSAEINQ